MVLGGCGSSTGASPTGAAGDSGNSGNSGNSGTPVTVAPSLVATSCPSASALSSASDVTWLDPNVVDPHGAVLLGCAYNSPDDTAGTLYVTVESAHGLAASALRTRAAHDGATGGSDVSGLGDAAYLASVPASGGGAPEPTLYVLVGDKLVTVANSGPPLSEVQLAGVGHLMVGS